LQILNRRAEADGEVCSQKGDYKMPYVTSHDGTSLFYRQWGDGPPVILMHAWAMNSDVWQSQMIELSQRGVSCIAYDRRGHGRSDDPGRGYDFDSLADDLDALLQHLDLRNVTLVGHSMSNGECVRYLTRHGNSRVARMVMVAPSLPYMLKTPDNPDGPNDKDQLDGWRTVWKKSFAEWLGQAVPSAFSPDTPPARIQSTIEMMTRCTLQAAIETNVTLAETDFRGELPDIKIPTLILHGDQDSSCPLEVTGCKVAKLIRGSQLKVYQGARHSIIMSHLDQMVGDILSFLNS
jgi:pimeloyl-ACP methyl ester carboxylesterase